MTTQIQLFGVPSFRIVGSRHRGQLGHAGELLGSFLFCFPGRAFRQEYLRELFWPDIAEDRARGAMNTVLWRLRRMLEQPSGDDRLLLVHRGEIILEPSANLAIDFKQFESAAQICLAEDGGAASDVAAMRACVLSYDGPLLDGETADWAVAERDRLQGLYLRVLSRLASNHTRSGELDEAIAVAHDILRIDPLREATHRDLIILFALNEQRARAIRQFERLQFLLKEDVGVSPSREIVSLIDALRSGEFRDHFVKLQSDCFRSRTICA